MGVGGDGGPATSAQLHFPSGVSVDGARNLYIADQGNNAVRRVDSNGTIYNFAGTHTNGYIGDGGLAVNAQLSSPKGVAADGWGRVYIADYDNNVVRMVASSAIINGVTNAVEHVFSLYPNPTSGELSITLPAGTKAVINVSDVSGKIVATKEVIGSSTLNFQYLSSGDYLMNIQVGNEVINHKFTVSK
jgi:hypothetical protein